MSVTLYRPLLFRCTYLAQVCRVGSHLQLGREGEDYRARLLLPIQQRHQHCLPDRCFSQDSPGSACRQPPWRSVVIPTKRNLLSCFSFLALASKCKDCRCSSLSMSRLVSAMTPMVLKCHTTRGHAVEAELSSRLTETATHRLGSERPIPLVPCRSTRPFRSARLSSC